MSKPRRSRIRLLAAERAELERRVAARTASQQDAYRAQIILRVQHRGPDRCRYRPVTRMPSYVRWLARN